MLVKHSIDWPTFPAFQSSLRTKLVMYECVWGYACMHHVDIQVHVPPCVYMYICRLETDIRFSPPSPATLLPEARRVSPQGSPIQSVLLVSLPWRFPVSASHTPRIYTSTQLLWGFELSSLGLGGDHFAHCSSGPLSFHMFKNSVSE